MVILILMLSNQKKEANINNNLNRKTNTKSPKTLERPNLSKFVQNANYKSKRTITIDLTSPLIKKH